MHSVVSVSALLCAIAEADADRHHAFHSGDAARERQKAHEAAALRRAYARVTRRPAAAHAGSPAPGADERARFVLGTAVRA